MESGNVNVRVSGELREHLQQQLQNGVYENASEYVRDLIRRDLKSKHEAWQFLANELAPGLLANEAAFIEVTADEVIRRNTKRKNA